MPGLKTKLRGRYEDTPANRSFISRLVQIKKTESGREYFESAQFGDAIRRPKDFQPMRPRSEASKKALAGQKGIGNLRLVDKGHYDRARIRDGHLLREKFESVPGGVLVTQAIQILNPGPNLLGRLRDLARTKFGKRLTARKQNILGHISGAPFRLHKFTEGLNLVRAAINYLIDWQPNAQRDILRKNPNATRKAEAAKEALLDSMSIIVQKKRPGEGFDFGDDSDEDDDGAED